MKAKLYLIVSFILIAMSSHATFADVKVKSKQTMSGQSYENTTYIKGRRQRTETMSRMMVSITQCDLRRAIQMNPSTKTFVVNEFGEIETTGANPVNAKTNAPVTKGGRVLTTITIKDTGERKQMFGFTARHLIITMSTESSPESCSKTKSKMETDGWYIDFEPGFDCEQNYNARANTPKSSGGCQDKYEMKTIGTGKRGYPLYEKMTFFDESGKETMSMVNEVVELSKATLDPTLFEVPTDYQQVSDAGQMFAAAPSAGSALSRSSNSQATNSGLSSSIKNAAGNNTPAGTSPVGGKQPGVIRIGIADVKTGAIGEGITATELAAAVKNTFIQYLKVPNVEIVTLDAKLASAIDQEARAKECDFVLYSTVSHKKGGGGFGKMFGSALGSAIGRTGIGHTGSTAGNIAGQIATQSIVSATSVSSQVKAKDEISLDVKVTSLAGAGGLSKAYKVKAKSDGDDIVSAVIEQAAEAIVASISK